MRRKTKTIIIIQHSTNKQQLQKKMMKIVVSIVEMIHTQCMQHAFNRRRIEEDAFTAVPFFVEAELVWFCFVVVLCCNTYTLKSNS